MKTLSLPRLHYITAGNSLHPAMQYVKIENNKAMATDAFIVAVVDLSHFNLELPNCYILARDWKKMCANKAVFRVDGNIVEIISKSGTDLIRFIPEPEFPHNYPSFEGVIPSKESIKPIDWIGLNSFVLAALCAAFPNVKFEFKFTGLNKAIRFDAHNSIIEIHGAFCPIHIEKQ